MTNRQMADYWDSFYHIYAAKAGHYRAANPAVYDECWEEANRAMTMRDYYEKQDKLKRWFKWLRR